MNVYNNKNDVGIYRREHFYRCQDVHSKIRDMINKTRYVFESGASEDPNEILDYMSSILSIIESRYAKETGEIQDGK